MDLYLLNEIQKLKSGGGSSSSSSTSPGLYPNETPTVTNAAQTIVAFSGMQERYQHQTRDWQSSHPYAGHQWYSYDNDWRTIESKWRIPHGVGFYSYGGNNSWNTGNNAKSIRTHFANKRSIGFKHMQTFSGRGQDHYQPITTLLMFVRNTTANDITKTVYFHYTNRWNNGYEGAAFHLYTPNHIDYSSATRNNSNWSTPWNTSSGGGQYSNDNASVTFPANKTVCMMLHNTSSYWTNSSYWTHTRVANHFSQIDSMFDGTGQLVCDLQMSQVYKQARIPEFENENYNNNESFFRFYNKCGELFGNRVPA